MKRFSEQLHKKATTVKLRAAEKRELKERLVSYMEYHPLPAHLKTKKTATKKTASTPADPFVVWTIPFQSIFKYSGVCAVLILVLIPFVAERAMPGDVLYAVKVQFNEEVRGSLTFDAFEKVEWETERLNRRIAEARLLASEGRLTEEAEADVAEAVRVHSANAQKEIEELRSEDADAATIASIALDTTLEVQSSSFKNEDTETQDGQVSTTTTTNKPVNLIATAIDESRSKSESANASTTLPAYDRLMAQVEKNTTRIFELTQSLQKIAPEDDLVDVVRRSEDINRAIEQAIEVSAEDEVEARENLVEVLQRTQKLIVFINEIEVTNTVDIESLIPLVLTEEEMRVEKTESLASIQKKNIRIQENLSLVDPEEDSMEKLIIGQAEVERLIGLMSSSSISFAEFRVYAEQAENVADDVLVLMEARITPDLVPAETADDSESESEQATSTEEAQIEPEEIAEDDSPDTVDTDVVEEGSQADEGENQPSTETTESPEEEATIESTDSEAEPSEQTGVEE